MLNRRVGTLLTCLLLTSLAAFGREVPVANGDFEQGLDGWTLIKPTGFAHGTAAVVAEGVHGGTQAVRVVNPRQDGKVMLGLTNVKPFALPDDCRTFELRLWLRAAVAPQMMEVRVASTDRQGKVLTPWQEKGWRFFRPPLDAMSTGWYEMRAAFGAQPEWGGVQLTIWVNGSGADVTIDDLTLVAVNPRERNVARIGRRLPAGDSAALWWEGPLRKVYPDEPAPAQTGGALEFATAGGECDTAQLCVRPDRDLAEVKFALEPLTGPQVLPAGALRANWVGLVPVKQAMEGWSITGPTPDPLLTEPVQTVPAGQTRSLWLTVKAPRGTPAGTYRGAVSLSAASWSARVPVSLRVYGFDLPERPKLRTISRIWKSHPGAMDLFRRNLQEHRAGGTSYLGGIEAKREGDQLKVDVSKLAGFVERDLKGFGAEVFNIPSIFLGDASGLYNKQGQWFGFAVFQPAFDAAFTHYCRTIGDEVRRLGVMDYALWQVWDEPQNEAMTAHCAHLARLVKQAVPEARVYLTTHIRPELLDLVGIWNLPWPECWNERLVAQARAKGARIWAYQNSLYSLDVGDSSLLMRGFAWRLRRYGVTGVEWWAVSDWKSDPWTVPNQYSPQNGGGFFIYPTPNRQGAPIDSLRWEMYREGVEDYDLLTMLAEAEGPAALAEVVAPVALDTEHVASDPTLMERTKRLVCERLEKLATRR